MTKTIIILVILTIILACGGCGGEFSRSKLGALQKEKLPPFTPPQVREAVLSNGARLFILEDHELPIVNIQFILKAGSVYEPVGLPGLSDFTASLMRDGGTKTKTPQEVDALIDDTAVRIAFDSDDEMMKAGMQSLSAEMDKTLPLLVELVFEPRFDASRRELIRLKLIEQIKRNEDDPEFVAARDFDKLVYGEGSPWAIYPKVEDIKKIAAGDIESFWKTFVRPNNLLIAASGDFNADELITKFENSMAGASNEPVKFPEVRPVDYEFKEGARYVVRDVNQAYIYMGHLGIKRHNPDKYALQVMNMVLGGGGFKSRLMEDIRASRGLAYSVWSHFGWGTDYGLFRIYAATEAKNLDKVEELILEELTDLSKTGKVTPKELKYAKDIVLNRLIFEFDEPFKIVMSQAEYYFYGYPKNYWEIYRDGIAKVDRGDVKRVAKKYLHPDELKTVVVGPKQP